MSGAAERDFSTILEWTAQAFGSHQARIYRDTLLAVLAALGNGPAVPGSRPRDEILPGLRTLHVARSGRRGRHFILYRTEGANMIEIVRTLHEAMDLPRHAPRPDSDSAAAPEAGC